RRHTRCLSDWSSDVCSSDLTRDHENLRSTYERMLERGPERFQVKPSGVPEMAHLYDQLPNFIDALDDVKRHVALSQDSRDGLEEIGRASCRERVERTGWEGR